MTPRRGRPAPRGAALPATVAAFPLLLVLGVVVSCAPPAARPAAEPAPIDREALVRRHNPVVRAAHPLGPLSVGNGTFAFTADVTGLQSFPAFYRKEGASGRGSIPLATQAQWGWHTFPNPEGYRLADALAVYDSHGRAVEYASDQSSPAGQWLRQNPHRLHLGRLGFALYGRDGRRLALDDLRDVEQTLDLWTGTLVSRFSVEGSPVVVQTWVHPERDVVAVRVVAPALGPDRLRVRLAFPYGGGDHVGDGADWEHPGRHRTVFRDLGAGRVAWERTLDEDRYFVQGAWPAGSAPQPVGEHVYAAALPVASGPVEFVVAFSPEPFDGSLPSVPETRAACRRHWERFWTSGAAVDFSGSTDPRAGELERRVVLSQYLTAIQTAGALPPQETGLTFNSWYGKFHLEMHWWHGVHFALWDRLPLLERSLGWYADALPAARRKAARQGYEGARWPKMVGPDGRESPSGVGVFLVWQQPHPIYFAELVYRQRPGRATLERYRDVVFETAAFMASYAAWDAGQGRYTLGPPLIPAQEIHPATQTFDPAFELAYWRFGLATAQRWRERLGLPREPAWDHVLDHLPPLPQRDGLYVNAYSAPETFTDPAERRDHPTLLAACGMLPCDAADPAVMRRTLHRVLETWQFDHTWGWDYPLVAMTAARVGAPHLAVDALLMDMQKNTYLPNGHNYQDPRLTLYLPGNGGLLAAVAMMAAGWDGAPDVHAPGFPHDGTWTVRWEGLHRLP